MYQENGVTFDLTANNIEVVGVINQLNKTATIESLGVQYDNLIQVDALGSGNSVGEFGFRIVANSVNTILQTDETVKRVATNAVPNADYNPNYVGMTNGMSCQYDDNTILFGGGTPSILTADEWTRISAILHKSFDLGSLREWSVECNPESFTEKKAKELN